MSHCAAAGDMDAGQHEWTPLHRAAASGDRQHVEQLLAAGADLGARTHEAGQTPLHVAAAAGNAELLPLLINLDILDVPDSSSHTALQLAVQGKWLDAAKVLLDAGASLVALNSTAAPLAIAMEVFAQGGPPQLPLMLLAATLGVPGLAKVVEEAVQRRHRPTNKTALHFAAHAGCTELVAKLVEAGADRNAVDSWQATPLWCAVWAGHVQLVPLLGTPSNINQPAAGVSPLLAATQQSHLPSVTALLAAGAAVGTDPCSRDSPLATAAAKGHKRMVALLLEALVRECGQQDEQQQGQTHSQQHQEEQPQQQPQQQQQRNEHVLKHLAAAVVSLAHTPKRVRRCFQLMEVVLDVLGPGVAGQVCLQVQQQLHTEPEQQSRAWCMRPGSMVSHLTAALLLGWLSAEERMHAARQPLVARLQRLVPGVARTGPQQQQQQQRCLRVCDRQQQGQGQQEGGNSQQAWDQGQLVQLVRELVLAAAAAGEQQEAIRRLKEFVTEVPFQELPARHQRHTPRLVALVTSPRVPTLEQLVQQGLASAVKYACSTSSGPSKCAVKGKGQTLSFRPASMYTTFLAGWVEARRQLQRQLVASVVTAVAAAQQRQKEDGDAEARLLLDPTVDWDGNAAPAAAGGQAEAVAVAADSEE